MSLPVIQNPIFKHTLVGLGKEVQYRQFTAKEQKILLAAKQDSSMDALFDAVEQIVHNCTLGKIDVRKLAYFDIEDLFLRIRAKSVGEVSNFVYVASTGERIPVEINLNDVKVVVPEVESVIKLDSTYSIKMRYPTLKNMRDAGGDLMTVMAECIESVFSEDEVFNLDEFTHEEVQTFIEPFGSGPLGKIAAFFKNSPSLQHTFEVELKDGTKESKTLSGLSDFFI